MRSLLLGIILSINSVPLLYTAFLETIRMWGRSSEVATNVLTLTVAITGTLAHLFVYLPSTSIKRRQFLAARIGMDRNSSSNG